MKVVHKNENIHDPNEDWATAREHEVEGRFEKAVTIYQRLLKKDASNPRIYDRLMILYRKLKQPEKELRIIQKALKTFESLYSKKTVAPTRKISALSAALLKATGLVDRKGKNLYVPEPIGRWQKRKSLLEKKMK
jgi:tetratricopeptide (TPR) repeat protein